MTSLGYVNMSELFKVHILSSNFRTCFFYLNESGLDNCKQSKCAIKIHFGVNRQQITYGNISLTPVSEVPDLYIGIAPSYANKLGLKENDVILVSFCDVNSISSLQIIPKREEDYVILLSCKSLLETYLLNQVSVVAEGQVLPLYVFSNISIEVEIGKLNLSSGYGQLEKFTEITVVHPSEKPNNSNIAEHHVSVGENTKEKKNLSDHILFQLKNILNTNLNLNQIHEQKNEGTTLKHLIENDPIKKIEYKIQPSFLLPHDLPKNIKDRFIIISSFEDVKNTFGPYSIKILAKVEKITNNDKKKSESDVEDKIEDLFLLTYVISLNNNGNLIANNYTAFCPPFVMKKLKMLVGSKITIEQVKPKLNVELLRWSEKINCDDEFSNFFWESMAFIRTKVRQTVINNFRYNYKINSLILGGSGTGKTFLLSDVANEFTNEFVFCKLVHCKLLRGKKTETLQKLFFDNLLECSCHEPSLFILDDLHALTYIDEDEGQFNKLYSDRVVDIITDILEDFQAKHNISVIASAINTSQLSALVSRYGPRLFQDVLRIPEMNHSERNFTLRSIINSKVEISDDSALDYNKLCDSTNGYSIQDLSDLIDKAMFNCLLRNDTFGKLPNLSNEDFDSALEESTPLNLRGVKLKQNIEIKWDNVGGMIEPKKILTEVFSWPIKYPNLLKSCPLRLQKGVLLYGAPGTGKTLLAGALANECGLNFISVKGPEVLSKYVGASEEGIRNLFFQAEKAQPCLLFFDEFDSLAPKRGHDNTGVTDRVVNQLLTQLDGVESLNGVWVLAATSRPDLLDPALLRPGRMDKTVFCDVPSQADRLSILEVLSKNLVKAEDVSFLEVAEKTEGYTGADLQAVLYNAQMAAIKEVKNSLGKKPYIKINQSHLSRALSEVKPSLSQREKGKYKKIYEKFLNSRKQNFVDNFEEVPRVTFA